MVRGGTLQHGEVLRALTRVGAHDLGCDTVSSEDTAGCGHVTLKFTFDDILGKRERSVDANTDAVGQKKKDMSVHHVRSKLRHLRWTYFTMAFAKAS